MIDPAPRSLRTRRLRVFIHADAARHARLRRVVADAGHDAVDSPCAADVVLADADYPSTEVRPVVALGRGRTGHAGVLPNDADPDQIDLAIRAVVAGLIVRAPGMPVPGFSAMKESRLTTLLTPREIEVLDAIGEGLANKAIARRLNISLHTVKFHIEALFRKLGVRTRTQAAAEAWLRRGETIDL